VTRVALAALIILSIASAGLAETIEGTFVFPGVGERADLQKEYLDAGRPFHAECGLSEEVWNAIVKDLTIHVIRIRPAVFRIVCEGEVPAGLDADRLLDAVAKAHHAHWVPAREVMRQRVVANLETKAQDARLRAERATEEIERFLLTFEEGGAPRVSLESGTRRLEEFRTQAIGLGIDREAIEAQVATIGKRIEARRKAGALDGADPLLDRLVTRHVELEIELIGLRVREEATRKVLAAELVRNRDLRKKVTELGRLERRRDRYRKRSQEFFDMLAQLYTDDGVGSPKGPPRRLDR
jgi:hypothetical protein